MMFGGRRSVTMILAVTGAAGLTAVAGSGGAMAGTRPAVAPRAPALNGTGRTSREIPGLAALNKAFAQVRAVSCASAGNCSASGFYVSHGYQAFVVSEVDGVWHKAIEVPRSAALNSGGYAGLTSVSCGTPGNCTAGGYYLGNSTSYQPFVVSEVNGTWHNAIWVPGIVSRPANGHVVPTAEVSSVSCGWAGNCSAGGWYIDSSSFVDPLVVSEVNGAWRNAIMVPGMTALTRDIFAMVTSVSCGSAGNCSAGGWYTDSSDLVQPFVVSEVNGAWHNAVKVPGITTLNRGGDAVINSVSCGSAGRCSALGSYTDSSRHYQVFVVSKA